MAVILRKDGREVLRIEMPVRIRYSLRTESIEVPIPGEKDPWIMQLGGVSRHLIIEWREVANDLPSAIKKIAEELMTGEIMPKFEVEIEEWGIKKECVLFDIDITQAGGEATTFMCRITLAVGVLI